MCLLQLSSTNPKFSYIIYKNTLSGMLIRTNRKGIMYGFYKKNSEIDYIVYFRDGINEVSYKESKDQEFEYLNKLRYMSSVFVINAISEFFKSTVKKIHADDIDGYDNIFFVNIVAINGRSYNVIKKFPEYFPEFNINIDKKTYNGYQISITTKKNLYHLLNFVIIFFLTISILSDTDIDLDESILKKIIDSMNIVNAPYYIRYLISSRLITNHKLFHQFKKQLNTDNIILNYGTTAQHRRDFIKDQLTFNNNIIDIGCGDGFYTIPFSQNIVKNTSNTYYACDVDKEELNKLKNKLIKKEIKNVELFTNYKDLLNKLEKDKKYDIIITEVIEHMNTEESQKLLIDVLNIVNFSKVIITTPNKDFNRFYNNIEMRHHDHKLEMTFDEFKKYINNILSMCKDNTKMKVIFKGIGDTVFDISCSSCAIFTIHES